MRLFLIHWTSRINGSVLSYRIVLFSETVPFNGICPIYGTSRINWTVLLKRKVLLSGTVPFNGTFLIYGTSGINGTVPLIDLLKIYIQDEPIFYKEY